MEKVSKNPKETGISLYQNQMMEDLKQSLPEYKRFIAEDVEGAREEIPENIVLETEEDVKELKEKVKRVKKVLKKGDEARKAVTRPIDGLSKMVLSDFNIEVAGLIEECDRAGKALLEWQQKKDEEEAIEKARIEAEQRRKREEERLERERLERLRNTISQERRKISQLLNARSLSDVENVVLADFSGAEFGDVRIEVMGLEADFKKEKDAAIEFVRKQEALKKEREEAAQKDLVESQKLAEMRLKQEEEKEENERVARENERVRRENELEAKRLQDEANERERVRLEKIEEQKKLDELAQRKRVAISSGIKDISGKDLILVPREMYHGDVSVPDSIYSIKFDKNKVKAYLKEHDSIPGIEIEFENKVRF